jgi:virulence factor
VKGSVPIRVGVIGVGSMGQHHTRVLSLLKDVCLVGVADVNRERGLDTASKYRVQYFEDYRELLHHVDAACIAAPTLLHHSVGVDCIKAGKHILIEKPIASKISEAEDLVNLAAQNDCILQVGHIERFNPVFREMCNVLGGEELIAFEAHRMSPYSARANDVSVVLDLMIHDIDLLLEVVPDSVTIEKITASGNCTLIPGNLDYVTATLVFSSGLVATLTASKITHSKLRTLTVHCKDALVEADFLNKKIQIHRQTTSNTRSEYGQILYRQDGLIEMVQISNIEPLHAELEHFIHCVRGGSQPSVGGEQALKALRIAAAIEQMALNGKV